MSTKLLSMLAGAAMITGVSAASAAEPQVLSLEQMDAVSAGVTVLFSFGGAASSAYAVNSLFNTAKAGSIAGVGLFGGGGGIGGGFLLASGTYINAPANLGLGQGQVTSQFVVPISLVVAP